MRPDRERPGRLWVGHLFVSVVVLMFGLSSSVPATVLASSPSREPHLDEHSQYCRCGPRCLRTCCCCGPRDVAPRRLRLPNPSTDLEPLRLICEPASVASHAATAGYHPLPRRARLQGTGWPSPRVNTRAYRSPKASSGSSSRSIFRILARHVSTSLQDLSSPIEYNSVLSLLPRPLRTSRCVRESSSLCLERQRSFCSCRL